LQELVKPHERVLALGNGKTFFPARRGGEGLVKTTHSMMLDVGG
jgi:hypothetical protein